MMSVRGDLVEGLSGLLEGGQVGDGSFRDRLERLLGEKRLMAGNEDIGESQQPGEDIVLPLQGVLGTSPAGGFILAFCAAGAAITILVTETTKWDMRRQ